MFQKAFLKTTWARRFRSGMIALCAIGAIVLAAVGPLPLLANPGTVTVRVNPATRAAPVNGTFTVNIVADVGSEMNPNGLGAYQFDLVYDPNYLEVISVSDAGGLGSTNRTVAALGPDISNPDGRTTFAAYSHPPLDVSGPGATVVLATVTLKAKRAGVTTLNLENALLTDTQANAWPDGEAGRNLNVANGRVWIIFDGFFDGTYDDTGKRIGTDYDGDQVTDIAVWDPSSGKWYIKGSKGQNLFPTWGGQNQIPVPGNYDADRIADVGVWDPATGRWFIKLSGGGGFFPWWGAPGMFPVLGDYDGDRITDIAVWDPNTGKWYIKMSGGQRFFPWWGGPGNIPLPGDYDGDRITDVAVWNPANGKWYIKGSTGQKLYPTWGGPGLVPVPGDYDGDGTTDIAVWDPTNGKWYIKGSTGQMLFPIWGGPGMIPVPGDYDGDKITDVAVWNPANGKWYIKGSKGQNWTSTWGGATNIPVSAP